MYYEHKLKCLSCGLHYVMLSWDPEIRVPLERVHCPECGKIGASVYVGRATREGFMFQQSEENDEDVSPKLPATWGDERKGGAP